MRGDKMKKWNRVLVLALIGLLLPACKLGSSPTATFKAFYEAQKKKDVPGMKKTLSKGSLALVEKGAKEQHKSVDQAISEGFESPGTKSGKMPEIRNEKIDGTNATIEIQDEDTKRWETVYFVKEDGDWKIALDKTVEEMLKKIGTS